VQRPDQPDLDQPTPAQLEAALEAARNMLEMGLDPHHLGRLALYLYERNQLLERFVRDADRYFRFGQDDGDRRSLMRQIERLAGRAIQRPQFPV
jgi:hypothetical protein